MIPKVVEEYIEEYISQEVYVQIAIIKGKEKKSIETTIDKYFNTNHFKDFSEGKPYLHFIEGLKDKCLIKLKNSPMRNKQTNDEIIKELQNKLNNLSEDELNNTYWEIETGEFFSTDQIKELENNRNNLIEKLDLSKNEEDVYKTIISYLRSFHRINYFFTIRKLFANCTIGEFALKFH